LEIGGSPRALAVALGNGRRYGTASTLTTLRQFNDLTAADVGGVDRIVSLRGAGATGTDSIIGIGRNFSPARSVYGAINDIAPFTDSGLNEVIRYLVSEAGNLNQAGLGSLLAAKTMLAANPGSRIDFEVEIMKGGTVIRVIDVRLKLPAGSPLEFLESEVKEVTQIRVLEIGRSINQFARDVVRQIQNPPPAPFRPLSRLRWLIRHPSHPDGTPFTNAELGPVRQQLKDILRRAFDENILKNHSRRDELLQEFEQNFDDIVRFF
jgi:hypothetical protein